MEAKTIVGETPPTAAPPAPPPLAEAPPAAPLAPAAASSAPASSSKPVAEEGAKEGLANNDLTKDQAASSAAGAQVPAPAVPPVEPPAGAQGGALVKSGEPVALPPTPAPDASAPGAPASNAAAPDESRLAAIIPPRAPQSMLVIDDAAVGKDYAANLPPFSDTSDARGIALRAEPAPPDGLSFVDLGSGFGAISGKPTTPGRYAFDIVASNAGGGAARMTTKINIAPAPAEPKPPAPPARSEAAPRVAALEPGDKAARFLNGFDGGPCFFARAGNSSATPAARGSIAIEGVGSQKEVFERFYASFMREVGVEPTFAARLIAAPQCPAIRLIAAAHGARAAAPTIKLNAYEVSRGKPLSGSIGAMAGRRLDLLLIANDGLA